jgi:hypothetical protein
MPAIGASRPLRRIPTIVSFLNPQPALILVCGNGSSCPKATVQLANDPNNHRLDERRPFMGL